MLRKFLDFTQVMFIKTATKALKILRWYDGLDKNKERGFVETVSLIGWCSNPNGNVSWRRESSRKELNATSGAQFVALPLVKPVVCIARAVVHWIVQTSPLRNAQVFWSSITAS